jgi:NitT/TauT family transport system ATP-binding protein
VGRGELFAVVGPSGCGKTTLLNVIAGFLPADAGRVRIDGIPVEARGLPCVMVAQDLALFEWRTVIENVAFGLKARGVPKAERLRTARRYLAMVDLVEAADRYPYQLSGGMRQRLALARALAVQPTCLLLDEPLAALDSHLKRLLQEELATLVHGSGLTVVLVTHDVDEAVYLADRVMVLEGVPARPADIVRVDFPRPRQPALRSAPQFRDLTRGLLERVARSPALAPT